MVEQVGVEQEEFIQEVVRHLGEQEELILVEEAVVQVVQLVVQAVQE
jgi:hypothetical protein